MSLSKSEKSYITAALFQNPPHRSDSRSLAQFRPIALQSGVSPLANGSARLSIGQNPNSAGGGTEILAATKLEVEAITEDNQGSENGRFIVTVSCSPAAYPHLTQTALDDLQHDLTVVVHTTLTHPSLHPRNLTILPRKKSWLLHLDILVLADSGNIYDALFLAARAALWDTKVPRTRSIEYRAPARPGGGAVGGGGDDMDVDTVASGLDTRPRTSSHTTVSAAAADFELLDYWDEGDFLDGRDRWPVCVTLNLAPPIHFLDATLQEEAAVPLRLLLIFSFSPSGKVNLQAMRTLGPGELSLGFVNDLIQAGQKHAQEIFTALNVKLKDEDVRRTQKARDRFAARR